MKNKSFNDETIWLAQSNLQAFVYFLGLLVYFGPLIYMLFSGLFSGVDWNYLGYFSNAGQTANRYEFFLLLGVALVSIRVLSNMFVGIIWKRLGEREVAVLAAWRCF